MLSGGASLGAIQVGMLQALAERDIRPDAIIGTSVGAVNGAVLADRGFSVEAVEELGEIWLGMRRGRLFPTEPLTGFLGFVGVRRNLVPAAALRRLIARHVEHERLEDLPTGGPCELTAPPRGALGMLIYATSLLVAQRFAGEAMTLTDSRVRILPPPCPIRVQPTDFGQAGDLIMRGHDSAAAFLDDERARVFAFSSATRRRARRSRHAGELPSAG